MRLSSSAFQYKEIIPVRYTCKGLNVSPPLEISDVPVGTKSFILVVKDVNATPKPWIHWLIYNIPADIKVIREGSIPGGAREGICNGGTYGYEGPCPKYFTGIHSYRFSLAALDTILNIPMDADYKAVSQAIDNHILEEATLIGFVVGTDEKAL